MDARTLEGTSDGTKGGVSAVIDTIRQIRKEDSNRSTDKSVLTAADNSSVPFILPAEEEAVLLEKLRQAAKDAQKQLVYEADDFWLLACLRVRKGDIERALALANNYLTWRTDVNFYAETTTKLSPAIRDALSRGVFLVAGNESRDERPVLTVRYKMFNPRIFSALDTARALGLMIEYMLREFPKSQTHGIVVVEDAADFSLANFDIRLIRFLSNAFTKVLPVRIGALNITNPGWILKTMLGLLQGFLSKKLKARVRLINSGSSATFAETFEPHQTPKFLNLGGTLEWSQVQQDQMVEHIAQQCQTWAPATSNPNCQ